MINYITEDVVVRVQQLTGGVGVDHLVEVNFSANAMTLPGLVKPDGFIAIYGTDDFTTEFPAVGAVIQQLRFAFFIVFALPQGALIQAITDLSTMLGDGVIFSLIHTSLPLEEIAQAHERQDNKSTVGNVVLSIL